MPGPAPKDPSKRARRNNDGRAWGVLEVVPTGQPDFVSMFGEVSPIGSPWNPLTLEFWKELGSFPTTKNLVGAQWTLLGVGVMLFDQVLAGKFQRAEEMRMQLGAFGISPADVARLRVTFAVADAAEDANDRRRSAVTASRYEKLRAVE